MGYEELIPSTFTLDPKTHIHTIQPRVGFLSAGKICLVNCNPMSAPRSSDMRTLEALSICRNWPAAPLPDQSVNEWSRLFLRVLLKNYLLCAYYLRSDWSGWIVLIKSEILITTGMVWPVSPDEWKAPLLLTMVQAYNNQSSSDAATLIHMACVNCSRGVAECINAWFFHLRT